MANAYMDALICGIGIAKVTRLPNGEMELGSVSIDEFYDLSKELLQIAKVRMHDDDY